jgi:hypothetical protein
MGGRSKRSISTLLLAVGFSLVLCTPAAAGLEQRPIPSPKIKAPSVQKQGKRIKVKVVVGAGALVSVSARGWIRQGGEKLKLRRAIGSVAGGNKAKLELRTRRRWQERRIKRALGKGRELPAQITVTLSAMAGSEITRRLSVRLT